MHTAQPLFTNPQQGPLLVRADFNELFLISDTLSNLLINFISSVKELNAELELLQNV